MKIGIDLFPLASPATRDRGIGRYALGLARALVAALPRGDVVLYARTAEAFDWAPEGSVRRLASPHGDAIPDTTIDALGANPDGLDWLIYTSPIQSHMRKHPAGLRTAAICYDAIPDRMPGDYLEQPQLKRFKVAYMRAKELYGRCNLLLTISDATHRDFVHVLGNEPGKVRSIGCAVDHAVFRPADNPRAIPPWIADATGGKGFVLHVGAMDPRKGGERLIDAFARIPMRIRTRTMLLYAYNCDPAYRTTMNRRANLSGVDHFAMLGQVSEAQLVSLYQYAYMSVFPSQAEGFGLPILESLACGTPVVCGDNTGQVEAVGNAGITVDPLAIDEIAEAVVRMVDDTWLRSRLSAWAVQHASKFTWEAVAYRAIGALREGLTAEVA